ncbi:MAG: hypothetical protein EU550_01965 [Promethearchaeota archaeon]|nr:MAG: hypothetical protein EU550_01965 [Candidatus Lokiarchaeota archaeon]
MKSKHFLLLFIFLIFFVNPLLSLESNVNNSSKNPIRANSLHIQSQTDGNYLIITTSLYEKSLEPLKLWKDQKGIDTTIITVEAIESDYSGEDIPEKIKNCIKDYHDNYDVEWVLLAGDNDDVPSRYAYAPENYPYDGNLVSCDSYYADLDNDWDLNDDSKYGYIGDDYDFIPEVYVGRLSANNEAQMRDLVNRILKYEREPTIGDWMEMALYAGSFIAFEEDWNNDGVTDLLEIDGNQYGNYLKDRLPENFSFVTLGETGGIKSTDYDYNKSISTSNLREAIQNGSTIGVIDGHGNPGGIYRMIWTEDVDGDGLFDWDGSPYEDGSPVDSVSYLDLWGTYMNKISPQEKLGVFFLLGCSNGQFDYFQDCLAEYFIKDSAIACIAGSYVTWAEDNWTARPEAGWYSQGLCTRFFDELLKYKRPGMALALAKEDYIYDRISSGLDPVEPGWENKTLKQFNLFGDPEIPIWLGKPKMLNASFTNQTSTTLCRIMAENQSIENATITVTIDGHIAFLGKTNNSGFIELPYTYQQVNDYIVTATKLGYVPFQTPKYTPNTGPSIPGFLPIIILLISMFSIASIIRKMRITEF